MSTIETMTTPSPGSTACWPSTRRPRRCSRRRSEAYARGYRRMDAYTPFPVEGLAEAIGFRSNRIPLIVLIGGLARRRPAASA